MEASSRSASFVEEEVEWGAILPPLSRPHTAPSPHRDMVPLPKGSSSVDTDRSTPELRVGRLSVHPGSFFMHKLLLNVRGRGIRLYA
jgi:hypothetical protein